MPRRIDSLRALCDLTRGADVGSVRLTLDELEGLLTVAEVARKYLPEFDNPVPCLTIRTAYRAALREALAKLDEVQP